MHVRIGRTRTLDTNSSIKPLTLHTLPFQQQPLALHWPQLLQAEHEPGPHLPSLSPDFLSSFGPLASGFLVASDLSELFCKVLAGQRCTNETSSNNATTMRREGLAIACGLAEQSSHAALICGYEEVV
jgi:hypothetical protein